MAVCVDSQEAVMPSHETQQHGNHEQTEALQPRLSLVASTLEQEDINTTVNAINTTLDDINSTTSYAETACINTSISGFLPTAGSGAVPLSCSFNGFLSSTSSPKTSCINTTSGFLNTTNRPHTACSDGRPASNGFLLGASGPLKITGTSCGLVTTSGFEETTDGVMNPSAVTYGVAATEGGVDDVAGGGGGVKRKRDWMNSLLTEPQLIDPRPGNNDLVHKAQSSSCLHTSVRISNGSISFPAGWEQYLDLQTGETYYVNWNTRTKHCKVQCPEVQRCLARALAIPQEGILSSPLNNTTKLMPSHNASNNKKDTIEDWLSKMSETTSTLVNNLQSSFASKPPLPPINSLNKPTKKPSLDLSTTTLFTNTKSPKNPSKNVDTTFTLGNTLDMPIKDINDSPSLKNSGIPMPFNSHGMHNPNFNTNQACNYASSNQYW